MLIGAIAITTAYLECLALEHFHAGSPWTNYWRDHAADALALPDGEERARLVERLFSIVTSGDAPARPGEPGAPPVDGPLPHDSMTEAHYLGLQEVNQ